MGELAVSLAGCNRLVQSAGLDRGRSSKLAGSHTFQAQTRRFEMDRPTIYLMSCWGNLMNHPKLEPVRGKSCRTKLQHLHGDAGQQQAIREEFQGGSRSRNE